MRDYFDQLYKSTGDMLDRAYAGQVVTQEIINLKITYDGIEYIKSRLDNNDYIEQAIEALEYIQARLITIIEDDIYTVC